MDAAVPWEGASVSALFAGDTARPFPRDFRDYDVAVAYTRSPDLSRSLAAGIARVVTHDPSPPAGESVHASEWLSRPLEAMGLEAAGTPPLSVASAEEIEATRPLRARLREGFLAVHPGSGSARKNWPTASYARLAESVSGGRPWLLVEGPADVDTARHLGTMSGAVRATNLPPRVLGALLASAGVYVGNDSGVSHLAAAWGAPTVALFGPTDPAVWSPVGPNVSVVRAPGGSLDALAVGPVESAVRLAQVSGGCTSTRLISR